MDTQHEAAEIAPAVVTAIGLALLLEHQEGAGQFGRIAYIVREPAAEDSEQLLTGCFASPPELEDR